MQVRVEGFDTVPDEATSRKVVTALFELVGDHNIIALNVLTPPLSTQYIALVDPFGQPFAAMIGTGVGEPETDTQL